MTATTTATTTATPDILKTAYAELGNNYRAIDTFRSSLLGFLPLGSVAAIALLRNSGQTDTTKLGPDVALGIFGFVITLGLFFFELYGIRKCHNLIDAGRRIEVQLGVDGPYVTRPRAIANLINEPFASGVIYPTVMAAWAYVAVSSARLQTEALPIAIGIFVIGFACTLAWNLWLGREAKERT